METLTAPSLHDEFTSQEAVDFFFRDLPIEARLTETHIELIYAPKQSTPRSVITADAPLEEVVVQAPGRPEVIFGNSPNVEPVRDVNDPGSPVVYSRDDLERSGATDVGQFLRSRDTRSVPLVRFSGSGAVSGGCGTLNARGIERQTRFLIDGRENPCASTSSDSQAPDIDAIPIVLIDRIDTVSGTASAPGAVGVINLVTRRAKGKELEIGVRAEQSVEASPGTQEIWIAKAFELAAGPELSISTVWQRREPFTLGSHDTVTPGRNRIVDNNADFFRYSSTPPLGAQMNVRLLSSESMPYAAVPSDFRSGGDLAAAVGAHPEYGLSLPTTSQLSAKRLLLRAGQEVLSTNVMGKMDFGSHLTGDLGVKASELTRWGVVNSFDEAFGRTFAVPASVLDPSLDGTAIFTVPTTLGETQMRREDSTLSVSGGLTLGDQENGARLDHSEYYASAVIHKPRLTGDARAVAMYMAQHVNEPVTTADLGLTLQYVATPEFGNKLGETSLRYWTQLLPHSAVPITASFSFTRTNERLVNVSLAGGAGDPLLATTTTRYKQINRGRADLDIPLVAPDIPGGPARLSAQLSTRYEDYEIRLTGDGSARSFRAPAGTASLQWWPRPFLELRAMCGHTFTPPPLSALTDPVVMHVPYLEVPDPARGGEYLTNFDVTSGGNSELNSEQSQSCGGGFVFTLGSDDRFRMSIDYTHIKRHDVVLLPESLFFLNPYGYLTEFPHRVQREDQQPGDTESAGRVARIDSSAINLASEVVRAVDFGLDGYWKLDSGRAIQLSNQATYTPSSLRKTSLWSEAVNEAGRSSTAPVHLRMVTDLVYLEGRFQIGTNMRLISGYGVSSDPLLQKNQGNGRVDSQFFQDFFLRINSSDKRHTWEFRARNVWRERGAFDAGGPQLASVYSQEELPMYSAVWRWRFDTSR